MLSERVSRQAALPSQTRSVTEAHDIDVFRQKFKLPKTEFCIVYYSCKYKGAWGYMYISPNFLCFEATFTSVKLVIAMVEIKALHKVPSPCPTRWLWCPTQGRAHGNEARSSNNLVTSHLADQEASLPQGRNSGRACVTGRDGTCLTHACPSRRLNALSHTHALAHQRHHFSGMLQRKAALLDIYRYAHAQHLEMYINKELRPRMPPGKWSSRTSPSRRTATAKKKCSRSTEPGSTDAPPVVLLSSHPL